MEVPSFGDLFEGELRRQEGHWKLEQPDGTLVDLDMVLSNYLDDDVRLTVVRLDELDELQEVVQESGVDPEDITLGESDE